MNAPAGTMNTCPICAGALDADGLCPACLEGSFDGRPALGADGTLASPAGRPPPPLPEPPPADRTPPAVPPAPDPGYGVPLELDLRPPPVREERLELDETALASVRSRSASVVVPSVPVEHVERPRRRRWPWVLLAIVAFFAVAATGAGVGARHAADAFLREVLARLPDAIPLLGEDAGKAEKERSLEPGLAGEVLVIDSEPSGAQVFVGDELLGVTPLAVDNPYPDGEPFTVTVKKPGYRPARVGARGGGPSHLEVKLERAVR